MAEERKNVEQRKTSGEEIPPKPVQRRQGDRSGAGADTPSGPATRRTTKAAKQEHKKQEKILAREGNDQDRGGGDVETSIDIR